MDKYLTYQVEDFAADESFQQWVLKENKTSEEFWGNFLKQYPEKQEIIDEAVILLRALQPNKNAYRFAAETQAAIAQFQANIHKQKIPALTVTKTGKVKQIFFSRQTRRIAAVFLVLLTFGAIAYFLVNNLFGNATYQTAYGETQKITLPDGSVVTLNSNSTLEFAKNWEAGKNRAVRLEGEAFFEVKKQTDLEKKGLVKFTVYSANVEVEVLGTQFNVWNRKNQVAVVLNEGKVKLNIKGESDIAKTVEMLPNERVEIDKKKASFIKKQIKTELYTSWKAQEFVFENTPLTEVANKIEEVYGLKVKFQDKKLEKETLTGVLSCKNEKLFFEVLAAALDIKIEKKGKEVLFLRIK